MPLIERRFLLNKKNNVTKLANFKVGDIVYLSNAQAYKIIGISTHCVTLKNHTEIVKVQSSYLYTKDQLADLLEEKKQKAITKALENLDRLNNL